MATAFRYQSPNRKQTAEYLRAIRWWKDQHVTFKAATIAKNNHRAPSMVAIQKLAHKSGVI